MEESIVFQMCVIGIVLAATTAFHLPNDVRASRYLQKYPLGIHTHSKSLKPLWAKLKYIEPEEVETFYNPYNIFEDEDYFDSPAPEFVRKEDLFRDDAGLPDWTIEEIAKDYDFPMEFFGWSLCKFGISPPILPTKRLRDIVDAEQAFALLEAMTSLDRSEVRVLFIDDSIKMLSKLLDVSLSDIFKVCSKEKIFLPFGVNTHLHVEDYAKLRQGLGMEPLDFEKDEDESYVSKEDYNYLDDDAVADERFLDGMDEDDSRIEDLFG